MNKRILIIITIILVGILAGTGGYFIVRSIFSKPASLRSSSSVTTSEQRLLGRGVCRRLNFSSEQQKQSQTYEWEYRQHLSAHLSQLDSLRGVMIKTLIHDAENDSLLNAISNNIGQHHKEMKQISINHIQHLKSICTPEQERMLNGMLEELLEYPQYGKGRGKEMPKERRRHRRGRN